MYTTARPNVTLPSRWITRESPGSEVPPHATGGDPDLASGLRLVGMPHRQARLYLVLSQGPQTARHAAEAAKFHRATAYRLIVRLLERGLIVGDGRSPQRFQAAPPELLLTRLERFLREEADLCATLTRAYTRWVQVIPAAQDPTSTGESPKVLSVRGGARDPVLAEIEASRQTLDMVVRPTGCSIAFRTGLLRTLGNLMRRGVRLRLLTDATPPDQRFVAALLREGGEPSRLLLRRHVAPVGAHYYLSDSRVAVRMPALGLSGSLPGIALAERDRERVRMSIQRFEALWEQASEPFGPAHSTRAYAWNHAARLFRSGSRAAPPQITPPASFDPGPPLSTPAMATPSLPRA